MRYMGFVIDNLLNSLLYLTLTFCNGHHMSTRTARIFEFIHCRLGGILLVKEHF